MSTQTRYALAWCVVAVMAVVGLLEALMQDWLGLVVALAVGANGVIALRKIRKEDHQDTSHRGTGLY